MVIHESRKKLESNETQVATVRAACRQTQGSGVPSRDTQNRRLERRYRRCRKKVCNILFEEQLTTLSYIIKITSKCI
jgi:hypothetical protein